MGDSMSLKPGGGASACKHFHLSGREDMNFSHQMNGPVTKNYQTQNGPYRCWFNNRVRDLVTINLRLSFAICN